jgi:hypothetical protein
MYVVLLLRYSLAPVKVLTTVLLRSTSSLYATVPGTTSTDRKVVRTSWSTSSRATVQLSVVTTILGQSTSSRVNRSTSLKYYSGSTYEYHVVVLVYLEFTLFGSTVVLLFLSTTSHC